MEVTAQLFRALGDGVRLRILRVLAVLGEQTVGQLAEATQIDPCDASYHLHALSVCGVVWRRRSASFVYYRVADEPSNELTHAAVWFLRDVFKRVRKGDPRVVAESDQRHSGVISDDALIQYCEAFTHPRRLQIIRYLSTHGPSELAGMREELRMSPAACSRHVGKLLERRLLVKERVGMVTVCRLVPVNEDGLARLFEAVVRHLKAR
jgi:DNA-binding transcriptional ArsR family regulator